VLPSICLLRSARAMHFVDEHVPGVEVPQSVIQRVAKAADQEHECLEVAIEQARHALSQPGVRGLHLISFRKDAGIATVCERLGIPTRVQREEHGYRHPLTV
jgi:methylenetetrahydrofolate reductase (NADPH)